MTPIQKYFVDLAYNFLVDAESAFKPSQDCFIQIKRSMSTRFARWEPDPVDDSSVSKFV
jgi:hypothetical protein